MTTKVPPSEHRCVRLTESDLDKLLPKTALKDWLEWASTRYHLLGPVEAEDGSRSFAAVSADRLPALDNRRQCASPKEAVLPSCETLFTFDPGDGQPRLVPPGGEFAPTLMVGMKPCDVRSLEVLDRVFLDGRFQDPYYAGRRKSLVTVAYVCESKRWSCFCSSVGDPIEWSLAADVALTDVGEAYVATANTPAGEELLGCPAFRDVSADELATRDIVWNACGREPSRSTQRRWRRAWTGKSRRGTLSPKSASGAGSAHSCAPPAPASTSRMRPLPGVRWNAIAFATPASSAISLKWDMATTPVPRAGSGCGRGYRTSSNTLCISAGSADVWDAADVLNSARSTRTCAACFRRL